MAADLDLVRRLSRAERGLAVVAVVRSDDTVHASVVNAGVLDTDAVDGGPLVAFVARGNARKLDYLRQRGRGAIVFRAGWEWVSVEGPARILGPDGVADLPALLRTVFTAAGGTHDDWATFDRAMADEQRVAVFITPARISSNG